MIHPQKVVFGPDLLVAALFDPAARETLNRWRDGLLVPVITRELLVLYLKTLRNAGVDAELIRNWSLWLTARDKALYLEQAAATNLSGLDLCRDVAAKNGAELLSKRPVPRNSE